MRPLIFLFWLANSTLAATFSITQPVIFDCQDGLGIAQLTWASESPGLVQVRVNTLNGPPLNAYDSPTGSASTLYWVPDGMKFYLVNQAGDFLAVATAHVSCGGTTSTIDPGLRSGSYFPLQVGNSWTYRINDRFQTGAYVTTAITGTEIIARKTYYLFSNGSRMRGDANGVVYSATATGFETVVLDPAKAIVSSYTGPIGAFSDATTLNTTGLGSNSTTYVRGIGPVRTTSILNTGSSGGLVQELVLIDVHLPGVRISVPTTGLNLVVDSTTFDLTARTAPNCALPCYFAACGLGIGQPDPAGTYRPCTHARVEASFTPNATVELQFVDSTGTVIFQAIRQTDVRLPLFTVPNSNSILFHVLPPGSYRLNARVTEGANELAMSSVAILIR